MALKLLVRCCLAFALLAWGFLLSIASSGASVMWFNSATLLGKGVITFFWGCGSDSKKGCIV